MSVSAILLQNFTAFEDTGWVELRPINLLFGRNSSGKSALIRALLLLRQSLLPPDERVFVYSTPFGVDLGGFREMVHCGKDESIVRFHFRCSDAEFENLLAQSPFPDVRKMATATLQLALGYAAARDGETPNPDRIELADMEICAVRAEGAESDLLFRAVLLNPEDAVLFGERWFVDGVLPGSDKTGAWKGFGCEARRGFLNINFVEPQFGAPNGYRLLTHIFGKLRDEISGFLKQIVHLGPIRPEPQRRYSFSRASADEWQARDWTAFRDFIGGRLGEAQTQEINHWLERLDLAKGGSEPRVASEIGSLFTEYEITIRESEEAGSLPLSAMGYGLSQVLPVIVQCVTAQPGSLVIVEQPELYLHPRAQAELGDLFIQSSLQAALASWREDAQKDLEEDKELPPAPIFSRKSPPGPYFLIETHSEHLLLRLRRRLAETQAYEVQRCQPLPENYSLPEQLLTSDDMCMQFVYREGQASRFVQIGLDEKGEFDASQAPPQFDEFFTDDLTELAALVRAQA